MPLDDDDRFKYRPKHAKTPVGGGVPTAVSRERTPVEGVPVHVPAPGVIPSVVKPGAKPESWEGTRTAMPRLPTDGAESVVAGIDRRMRETKNAALENLDRVESLRKETREDIHGVQSKVDAVIEVVAEVRADVSAQAGQNQVIIDMLKEAHEARMRDMHARAKRESAELAIGKLGAITNIELLKAAGLADIDALAKARADRRELFKAYAIKGLAAIGVLWAFISVTLLGKCGGGG